MKRLAIVIVASAALSAQAGTLTKFRIACKGAHNTWGVAWTGPWIADHYMERQPYGSGWEWYLGYLAYSGETGTKVPNNSWYRMISVPSGGSPQVDSNVLFIPVQACTPIP